MFVVLDGFFNGDITDTALVSSLSALKLGKQYVAIIEKIYKRIMILEEKTLSEKDRELLKTKSEQKRFDGISFEEEMCRKHRSDGRYFDEIPRNGE